MIGYVIVAVVSAWFGAFVMAAMAVSKRGEGE